MVEQVRRNWSTPSLALWAAQPRICSDSLGVYAVQPLPSWASAGDANSTNAPTARAATGPPRAIVFIISALRRQVIGSGRNHGTAALVAGGA
jgi:hypothetical protein